jgi:predicted porin
MKRTHLLIPALLLTSSAAMAQSSVTLYGLVDLGVGKLDGDKTQMHGNTVMNNTNSHIGLRGVEDLGGGLKAGFNFETEINAENGAGDGGWTRAANVWVGGNWGTFKMGRANTPSFWGYLAWEITGNANYSAVANTYGIVGLGERTNSLFQYSTPDMGGLQGNLGYIFKADNGGAARTDGSVTYANGPISAGLSVNKTKGEKTNWALGGKYSFGAFALAASYNDTRAGLATSTRRTGASLGGSASFGAASLTLDVTRDTKHELGNIDLKKYTNAVIEAKYNLSKRTFVYGAALRLDGDTHYGVGLLHTF